MKRIIHNWRLQLMQHMHTNTIYAFGIMACIPYSYEEPFGIAINELAINASTCQTVKHIFVRVLKKH